MKRYVDRTLGNLVEKLIGSSFAAFDAYRRRKQTSIAHVFAEFPEQT